MSLQTLNRCMGNRKNISQCITCKRLVRNTDDEDSDFWIDWKKQKSPCRNYMPYISIKELGDDPLQASGL